MFVASNFVHVEFHLGARVEEQLEEQMCPRAEKEQGGDEATFGENIG